MTIYQRNLTLTAIALGAYLLAFPVFACNNGECDPDPEPPSKSEPEAPSKSDSHEPSDRDRDQVHTGPSFMPCCIQDGVIVAQPKLFMSAKRALKICEREQSRGTALIYECVIGSGVSLK